jgi:hypothetical protein
LRLLQDLRQASAEIGWPASFHFYALANHTHAHAPFCFFGVESLFGSAVYAKQAVLRIAAFGLLHAISGACETPSDGFR